MVSFDARRFRQNFLEIENRTMFTSAKVRLTFNRSLLWFYERDNTQISRMLGHEFKLNASI